MMHRLSCIFEALHTWLFEWQTLVGSLIALVAALWTIRVMRQQMKSEAERHEDAGRRKAMAARALMPDALSDVGSYIRGCTARLMGTSQSLPEEPTVAVATLKAVIEVIENTAANRTFELISWYQVFRARMAAGIPAPNSAEFPDRMYDAALLQAYVNSLYDYARNEAQTVDASSPTKAEMTDALKNAFGLVHMVQNEELYLGVKAKIERKHA